MDYKDELRKFFDTSGLDPGLAPHHGCRKLEVSIHDNDSDNDSDYDYD